jgi:vanillate/3-O-methylgallate O-demethylase
VTTPLTALHGYPYYPETISYCTVGDQLRPWEFSGWKPESLSWKKSCYIHTGLSGPVACFDGPHADEFIAQLCTNSLKSFPEGTMRHAVMCNDNGLVTAHGILQRYDSGMYRQYAVVPWAFFQALKGRFNVRTWMEDRYLTQIAGPRSLEALQRASDEDLTDIRFLRYRKTHIAGKEVEIGRIGMSGNLAYDHDIGIERLGWRTYLVNHVEGGFPQMMWTFGCPLWQDPEFRKFVGPDHFALHSNRTGSYDPADDRIRHRTPYEVNWDSAVRFDHDFIGRAALERLAGKPGRRTVTLRWNAEDVIDIHASLFRPGEEYRTMDLPSTPTWKDGMLEHADQVLKDGRIAGVSSGNIYSYFFRECLSMGCVDPGFTAPGTELIVRWGNHGKRIKEVRVTVDRFPYLTDERNSEITGGSI